MPFDASALLSTAVPEMSTEYVNIPEGSYPGIIDGIDFRQVQTEDGEKLVLDINWSISDPAVARITSRSKNLARQSCWLDVEKGRLSTVKGANVSLGKLRETLRQNKPGWAPTQLVGKNGRVTIAHSKSKDRIYSNVTEVEAL